MCNPFIDSVREAFQTKKQGNFGPGPSRGGGAWSSKNQKSPNFSWEKFKIRGGGLQK